MLYFSELKNKTIRTEDGVKVGNLKDLIFFASEQPTVTKIYIRASKKMYIIVPIQYVKRINGDITLTKNYQTAELEENEIYVDKNLLDKQIIDIQGNKIVRVNDVVFQDKPHLYIAGVDIGILGVLRWLRIERAVFNLFLSIGIKLTSQFLSWGYIQPLELARGRVKLKKENEKLERIPPEDLADHLEKTNIINIKRILNLLDKKYAAEVVGSLNMNYQGALFRQLSPENAAKILTFVDPDEAVDILLTLSSKRRENIIGFLPDDVKKRLSYLLKYATTPVGEYMTTEYMTVSPKNTVAEVLEMIRLHTTSFSNLEYIYVINTHDELAGVFTLHELLIQKSDTVVYKFMTQNVSVVHLKTPKEIAIKRMLKYKLTGIPVIDNNRHILGIITFDDITEYLIEKL
jgi:CBS domain-containing protein/sporulation protein YlmC with PRC-barrel domain